MSKKLGIQLVSTTGTATLNNWKAASKTEMLSNTSNVPIRIDKLLAAVSGYHTAAAAVYVGVIVHLSDTNGNTCMDTIDGTGADTTADLNTLMEKWKDYIWMTDFRAWGTGSDENVLNQIELDAGTKRLLEPGQKLYVSLLWVSGADTSANTCYTLLDYALWYQAGA